MLRICLFGTPRIEHDGQALPLRRTKALALLAYLALADQPKDRDSLLALLWPEFDEPSARNNLRRELSLLRSHLPADLLIADRLQVRWNPQAACWVDVTSFHEQVATWREHGHGDDALCADCAAALETAARLAGDEFLAGFGVPESQAFEEWLFFQREALRQQHLAILDALAGWYAVQADYQPALEAARRRVALDPLHEPAQRALMRLYVRAGQRAAALRQYETCLQVLQAELGATPEPETTALYEEIKARRLDAARTERPLTRAVPDRLPPLANFVGRQHEQADIIRRLTDPACRLLTIAGPGGIGKTQLALAVAHTLAEGWADDAALTDGVLWVPLVAVSTPSGLPGAIAAAAGFDFYPGVAPEQQVIDFVRGKRMLIVLDNVEHLLDGAALIGELLTAAPGLRILVTSRQALGLHTEWYHPVDGLSFPAEQDGEHTTAQLARYDAIRLFERHARRLRSDFRLHSEQEAVVRLCRMVEGMPLAIELAASWLTVLPAQAIVAALERDLELLATRDRSVPARHRNMRTILEESWRQLTAQEQQALAGLAIFRGSFSAEAAATIAGASLTMLAGLCEKSLLRASASGRFQFHELLRQFAAEQLGANMPLAHAVSERYSAYFLDFLAMREEHLEGRGRPAAIAEIAGEAANIRVAWEWAIERRDANHLEQALRSYFDYVDARGDYQNGIAVFHAVLTLPTKTGDSAGAGISRSLCARAQIWCGTLYLHQGDYTQALVMLEHGLESARALGLQAEVAIAQTMLGALARWRGEAAQARRYLEQALVDARHVGSPVVIIQALLELAWVADDWGEHEEADRLAREGMQLSRRIGRDDLTIRALDRLAWAAVGRGQYTAAAAFYGEGLVLAENNGDELGIAHTSGGLGWVAWCMGGDQLAEAQRRAEHSLAIERRRGRRLWIANFLGDLALIAIEREAPDEAWAYAQEGLAIARALESTIYIAYHLGSLGRTAMLRGDAAASRRYLHEALVTASTMQLSSQLALALYHLAEALAQCRQPAQALELLAAVAWHAQAWHAVQERARRRIADIRHALPPEMAEDAIARGQRLDWPASIDTIMPMLTLLAPHAGSG